MDISPKGQVRLSLIIFAASVAITAFFSVPSWLPVFGIEFEWFGDALVVTTQRFLPLAAVMLGFIVGWVARGKSKQPKRFSNRELERLCSVLSDRKKAMLLEALETNGLRTFALDPDAYGLGDMDLLKSNPIGFRSDGAVWFPNPTYVSRLKAHQDKWIGKMNPKERKSLIENGSPVPREVGPVEIW